ncbi:MAG TPA: acyl-CoA dehydrogenase family protein [Methylomirabilota bacterium]|jgi:alkylation response protein AidB-like acyl-CoA dehydrogenase|nr:acyl-CoA dehydrogenase family protein [Methylomirabilota bacterium]
MTSEPGVVAAVRRFVEREVRPAAAALEHADAYPHALVARMRELGLFGALVPRDYRGLGLDVTTYARVIEELCRGWMSLAGVINSHTMAALIVLHHGTEEQRRRFLPRFASGEARGGLCLTEPHAGSDVQAIRTTARREGDHYVLDGSKMFITNGREGNTFALLAVTDSRLEPRHRGMSCFIVEKGDPGFRVVKSLAKLGYKGVDTVELLFEGCAVPAANLVGGVEGRGFGQVMSGLETGRINIAARCVGVAQAAWEAARDGARGARETPLALADVATKVEAARLITYWAAGMKDRRERCDLEAGMAKLYASEAAHEVAVASMKVSGEAGTLARSDVERHYRDTPLMIIGEGTNEIQRTLIARQLVDRYGERLGALTSREGESEERRQIVLAVRQFVDKTLTPVVAEHEAAGRWPEAIVRELAELGLFGAAVGPRHGGLGLDPSTLVMVLEELARGWTTVASTVAGHLVVTWALDRWVPAAAGALPALTRAERLATAVFGGDVSARDEGGTAVLSGPAALADNATRAGLVLVEARDAGGPLLAVVERDATGVSLGEPEATLGGRGLDPCPLRLDGARGVALPRAAVAPVAALASTATAAIAVGLAQAAFEAALRYSQQRTTFGKPLCQHQAVQLMLADMATGITAARLLTARAAETPEPDPVAADMARLAAASVAMQVTLASMRIHGGYGYVSEFPVERYYRDAARLMFRPVDDEALRRRLARALVAAG